jgi:hypothetical protein
MIEAEIASRRNVLRGGLAVACSLLIPAALLGCKAKPNETATSEAPTEPTPSAAPIEPTAPATEVTSDKVTQASVQYQAQPKGDLKCSDCMHFTADSSGCNLVEGLISPDGWCSLWSKNS